MESKAIKFPETENRWVVTTGRGWAVGKMGEGDHKLQLAGTR